MEILTAPFVNAIFAFYYLTGNLGVAVVLVTILVRVLLLPILLPSLKSAKKMRDLQPKLKDLAAKYKDDKQKLAQAQMDFYRENGINPLSGCLPTLFQVGVLMIFYYAFNELTRYSQGQISHEVLNKVLLPFFQIQQGFKFNLSFLGSDMSVIPSHLFGKESWTSLVVPLTLLIGSGVAQYFGARLMMPATKVDQAVVKKETPKDTEDDMMAMMRTQSLYMMPAMTIFLGWNFQVGMLLYWFTSSVVTIGQQVLSNKLTK